MVNCRSPLLSLVVSASKAHETVRYAAMFIVVCLILLPSNLQAGFGSLWDGKEESFVGQEVRLKVLFQNNGDGRGIVTRMANFRERWNAGHPELQALDTQSVPFVPTHDKAVGNPTTEGTVGGTGGEPDKDYKWLHSYLIGVVLGGLAGLAIAPLGFPILDRLLGDRFDRVMDCVERWLHNKGYLT